jgi:hypothetical protein
MILRKIRRGDKRKRAEGETDFGGVSAVAQGGTAIDPRRTTDGALKCAATNSMACSWQPSWTFRPGHVPVAAELAADFAEDAYALEAVALMQRG